MGLHVLLSPGWNMFQRAATASSQLNPGEWSSAVRRAGRQWSQLSAAERDAYEAQAAERSGLREEAMRQPFPSAKGNVDLGDAGFDAASRLPRSSLKRVSLSRLLVTYQNYKRHECWSQFDCGLATADAALSLDAIDLEMSQDSLEKKWRTFAQPAESIEGLDNASSLHHKVCGGGPGLCKQEPCAEIAGRFAHSLHRFIAEGPLCCIHMGTHVNHVNLNF